MLPIGKKLNKGCFLLTRFSKIIFIKRLGQVFALKHVTDFFKHFTVERLNP